MIFYWISIDPKDLTPEKVGEIIDDYSDIGEVAGKLGEAFTIAFGDEKNAQNPQAKKKTGD